MVKIGRTHLQDATPLTVGQEWSGYVAQLDDAIADIEHALVGVHRLAIGGTAVGTGINAPEGFGDEVAAELARLTGQPFVGAPNRFAAQSAMDDIVRLSASLRSVGGRAVQVRQRRALVGVRARAPAWTSCACRPTSPARRSCPAR